MRLLKLRVGEADIEPVERLQISWRALLLGPSAVYDLRFTDR